MAEEQIIGTIEAFKSRAGGQDFLILCFTPSRVIVAKTGRFNSFAWAFLLGLGNIFFFPSARRKARIRADQLIKLPVSSIIEAEKGNFQITYDNITSVEIKKPGAIIGLPMRITTTTTRYSFGIQWKNEFDSQAQLIRSVLGEKLSIL